MFRMAVHSSRVGSGPIGRTASFVALSLVIASIPAPARADQLYLTGTTTSTTTGGVLEIFNTHTTNQAGVYTLLGSTNYNGTNIELSDIAANAAGTLIGLDTSTSSSFYTVSTKDGSLSNKSAATGANLNALVYGSDGTLYAAGNVTPNGGDDAQVYTVNTSGNSSTFTIKALTNTVGVAGYDSSGDLSFVGSTLYLTEKLTSGSGSDILVSINTTTGVGTEVGSLGIDNVHGLATVGNTLYGFANNSAIRSTSPPARRRPCTAAATTWASAAAEIHGASVVPEPSSLRWRGSASPPRSPSPGGGARAARGR